MKILHIIESFDRGAVERWLLNVYKAKAQDSSKMTWEFFTFLPGDDELNDIVQRLGGRIHRSKKGLSNKLQLILELRQVIQKHEIDIVHSHHDYMTGLYSLSTLGLSVKLIAHSHNNDVHLPFKRWKRDLLMPIFIKLIQRQCCHILSISIDSLDHFKTNLKWSDNRGRADIVYYGINLPETPEVDPSIESMNGQKLLFVGRLIREKGPVFAMETAIELAKAKPHDSVHMIFVGEGDEENGIRELLPITPPNLTTHILGWCDDVLAIMQGCDIFLFPRDPEKIEGYGLVMLEAQSAGMLCAISHGVSSDTMVCKELCHRIDLMHPSCWADTISRWSEQCSLSRSERSTLGREQIILKKSSSSSFLALKNLYQKLLDDSSIN